MPYMAPEIIRGGVYRPSADIYSIGMLMYEVAAGHPPFLGLATDFRLACDICRGVRPTLPDEILESYKHTSYTVTFGKLCLVILIQLPHL